MREILILTLFSGLCVADVKGMFRIKQVKILD